MSITTRSSFRKLVSSVNDASIFIRQAQYFFRQCCKATGFAFIGFAAFTANANAQSFIESVERSRPSMPTTGKLPGPAPTISSLGDFAGASPVGTLQCNPSPVTKAEERLSPQASACDAPIDFVIDTLDRLATKVGERCLPALYSKLPGYAKDLKVLGALATGNPIALGFALGATLESDLRECGLEGVMDGLPVSDSVRSDIRDVHAAIKTSKEYLSLKDNMAKILSLKDQPIDASGLARDVRDAYLGHKEVKGLGKEITDLGKGLAGRFKDAAKDISALEKGIEGMQGLITTASQALKSQENLAEQTRGIARTSVARCQIETADKQLVAAAQKARRALTHSRQAIANARELRICTYELIQSEVGASSRLLEATAFLNSEGLHQKVRQFNKLARTINELEKDISRQARLLQNIGRQCKILHDESGRIQHTLDTYEQIKRSIEERLKNPSFCDFGNLVDRANHLESIEKDRCSWRLPTTPNSERISTASVASILARKRNVDVDNQLFDTLKAETSRAIGRKDFKTANQRLQSMEQLAKNPCIDGSGISALRGNLRAAVASDMNSGRGTGFGGKWKTNWGAMTLSNGGSGSYTHDKGKITGSVTGKTLKGTWSEAPSYSPPNDAGDVVFTLSNDGSSFSGRWRYGSKGNWKSDWKGTRVK
jgi:hypothetical protein